MNVEIKGGISEGMAAAVARLLFPPACPGCRRHVREPGTLCSRCWHEVRFIEPPLCAILGTPFAYEVGDDAVSPAALADPPVFSRARAAVAYSGIARQLVQNLKYRDRTDLAPWMARWMIRAGRELLRDAEIVVPVPLHRRRFFSRRFNQSAELARHVSHLSAVSFVPDAVERVKKTQQQVGLRASEREANMRGAFRVPDRQKTEVTGRRVLLVDDVYTTGATASAATRALKKAGAREVDVLTFALALPGDFLLEDAGPI
ncbi:MAG: ComF family protein [Rhizobiaceae bacterium]|nr:ComF family protein [Rhizobiaceae bacterium]